MRRVKYLVVLFLCLFMESCFSSNPNPDLYIEINIGDYEGRLEAWNNLNILDYQLQLVHNHTYSSSDSKRAFITAKNGIPESSEPPGWLTSGEMSTVPEVFSFVKEEEEKAKKNNSKSAYYTGNGFLSVGYHPEYHYPALILYAYRRDDGGDVPTWGWGIHMIPLVENEQEAWNVQNMLDYKLSVSEYVHSEEAEITVKNGIPESSDPPGWLAGGSMSTVQDFFCFVKEEEKRLEGIRATKEGFFRVIYHPVYHYPVYINGRDKYDWKITLTPLGDTE
ncbi:MAG: hypothetical protein LBH43_02710 [Treponema sp.]|jgi:hypothetical protein|nr:hypothetical protein [Treponema sp.]